MGKFKEFHEQAYTNQTEYFVQPTFVGLIELFRNLEKNLDKKLAIAKHPPDQADFSHEINQLERERASICAPEEFCAMV